MTAAEDSPDVAVLLFADQPVPGPLAGFLTGLAGLPTHRIQSRTDVAAIDSAVASYRRVVVVGADADLAAVLTRLLRADRLDVEVGYAPRQRTAATRAYNLPSGYWAARRARRGSARRVTLLRDETATALVGRAMWLPADKPSKEQQIHGEAIVDDSVLFDGDVAEVRIEPTLAPPGLRARVKIASRWRRWIGGRAAQLGTTGAAVMRDGVAAPRPVRRSTFYRHVEGWLLVR